MDLVNNYALEITKLYLSKKLNNLTPTEFAKLFDDTYEEICKFLDSLED